MIGLGDQPLVPAEAWRAVAACADTPIATAVFDGRRRPPVRLAAEVWPLLPTTATKAPGCSCESALISSPKYRASGEPIDIDTLEDLERWS